MSPLFHRRLIAVGGAVVFAACAATAEADVIKLKSGGELRGKIVKAVATDTVAIETLAGGMVVVPEDSVQFASRRPLVVEDYEIRARRTAETAEAHWELAQWCKDRKLTDQRTTHLQRVVEFAPDHEAAHVALGHVWKEGAWVDLDQYMADRGYVKHRGKFVTQQEFDLLKKTADELKREQEWHTKVRLWLSWVTGTNADRRQSGLYNLSGVEDIDAAPAVAKFLGAHPARDVRLLGVSILSRCPGEKSAVGLVKLALRDDDADVRTAALEALPKSQHEYVRPLFIRELRNATNAVVVRAGTALSYVGDETVIEPLISALVTTHNYDIRVPIGPAYSFGTDGSMGGGSSLIPPEVEVALRTGQLPQGVVILNPPDPARMRTVTVQRVHQNAEILAALQKLTGEDFSYDERTWQLWWAAKKHDGASLSKS